MKAYEKHAWIILFALGISALIWGLQFIFVGVPPDSQLVKGITGSTWNELVTKEPGATTFLRVETFRVFGMTLFATGILSMAIARIPYRSRERWAWYVSWTAPPIYLFLVANNLVHGGSMWPLFAVFLIAYLLGLLLPYRVFFPRKER